MVKSNFFQIGNSSKCNVFCEACSNFSDCFPNGFNGKSPFSCGRYAPLINTKVAGRFTHCEKHNTRLIALPLIHYCSDCLIEAQQELAAQKRESA